jgi:hypothetical protein
LRDDFRNVKPHPEIKIKPWEKWIALLLFLLTMVFVLYTCVSCKPCKELTVTKTDTVYKTVLKVDTVKLENKDLFNELQTCYQKADSFETEYNKCLYKPQAAVVINNSGHGKVNADKMTLTYSIIVGDNNQLRIQNAKYVKERDDYKLKYEQVIKDNVQKDKSKVKTDVSTDNSIGKKDCPGVNWGLLALVFFLGAGTGGFVIYKIGKV